MKKIMAKTMHSFGTRMFVVFLIIITIFVGGFSLILYRYESSILRNQVIADEKQTLNQMSDHISYIQDTVQMTAASIAVTGEVQQQLTEHSNQTIIQRLIKQRTMRTLLGTFVMMQPYFVDILIVTPEGTIYSSNNTEDLQYDGEEWYEEWKQSGGKPGYSKVHDYDKEQGSVTEKVISYITSFRSLDNLNNVIGDIIININVNQIVDLDTSNNGLSKCALYGENNDLILGEDTDPDVLATIKNGNTAYVEKKGNALLYTNNLQGGWVLISEVNKEIINAQLRPITKIVSLMFVVLIAILLISIFVTVKYFTKPIILLKTAAEKVGGGDYDVSVNIRSNDEFSVLGNAFNSMVVNIKELLNESIENEKESKEMEINRLMLQINPHFIYNTLNSIVYMARLHRDEDIVRFTNAFISLLQDTLRYEVEDVFTSVDQELTNVKNYVIIQKIRYPGKINAVYTIDEDTLQCAVPNVLIQPIVENAIYHGLMAMPEGGELSLQISKRDNLLTITVHDNGAGMSEETIDRILNEDAKRSEMMRKIGISNVRSRIKHIYGGQYDIVINSKIGEGTSVFVTIPCEKYKNKVKTE